MLQNTSIEVRGSCFAILCNVIDLTVEPVYFSSACIIGGCILLITSQCNMYMFILEDLSGWNCEEMVYLLKRLGE